VGFQLNDMERRGLCGEERFDIREDVTATSALCLPGGLKLSETEDRHPGLKAQTCRNYAMASLSDSLAFDGDDMNDAHSFDPLHTHSILLARANTATSLSSERERAMWMIEASTDGDAELHVDVIPEPEKRIGEGMTYTVVITKLPPP
jgi:hypothetical protein